MTDRPLRVYGEVTPDARADEFVPGVAILPRTKLSADKRQIFQKQIVAPPPGRQ